MATGTASRVWVWVKEHPKTTSVMIFVAGLVVIWLALRGGGGQAAQPAAGGQNQASLAAGLQHEAIQADLAAKTMVAQTQRDSIAAQINGQVQVAGIAKELNIHLADVSAETERLRILTSGTVSLAGIGADRDVQLAGITANADVSRRNIEQQGSIYSGLLGLLTAQTTGQLDLEKYRIDAARSAYLSDAQYKELTNRDKILGQQVLGTEQYLNTAIPSLQSQVNAQNGLPAVENKSPTIKLDANGLPVA